MSIPESYDFSGWATRNDIQCADGRTIRKDAFRGNDGKKVPLVWNHKRDSPSTVLGHAYLENRDEGVFAYGMFNDTKSGQDAKALLIHGDITNLSIWANNVKQNGAEVVHGVIKEVSLVTVGANPGAYIESVVAHGYPMDEDEQEGYFYNTNPIVIAHADQSDEKEDDAEEDEESVIDVLETLTDKQRMAVGYLIAKNEKNESSTEKENDDMSHSLFENGGQHDEQETTVLSHADIIEIVDSAKRSGSLRDAINDYLDGAVLAHSIDTTGMDVATGKQTYGINDISMFFPDAKLDSNGLQWIQRDMGWVEKVMNSVHRSPFARVRSLYANITEDEARAKGYIKGKQKKEEVFTTLKRTISPQTIYKFQKLDRDDILDITDFDIVALIRAEMQKMLQEEIARAILIGDGRPSDAEDKIMEEHIRSIANDVPLFNTKVAVEKVASDSGATAKNLINAMIRSRKNYKGSGRPALFTTEDVLTEMLLVEDGIGHKLYKTETELATALRVSEIITVEVMEDQKITINGTEMELAGIIVNLSDYNVGQDKGGAVSMFDDFDIQFNQLRYLIETRMSGGLVKPFSALTFGLSSGTSSGSGSGSNSTAVG